MAGIKSIVKKFSNQWFLYWEMVGSTDGGQPSFDVANPVMLKGRIEDRIIEILTSDGRKVITRGYVLGTQALKEGSMIFECPSKTTQDWIDTPSYPNIPTNNEGSREITKSNRTVDINNKEAVYESYF